MQRPLSLNMAAYLTVPPFHCRAAKDPVKAEAVRKQLERNRAANKAMADAGGNLGRVFREWHTAWQHMVDSIVGVGVGDGDGGDSSHKVDRGGRDQAKTSPAGKQAANLAKEKPVPVTAPPATEVRMLACAPGRGGTIGQALFAQGGIFCRA
jgi:hypothetical protein